MDTQSYHNALDVVPKAVVDLARFFRDLPSALRQKNAFIYSDPLSSLSWSRKYVEREMFYDIHESVTTEVEEFRLNWFGIARDCPVAGMPMWRWRQIVDEVRACWNDDEPSPPPSEYEDDPTGRMCADLLLDRCASFMLTFLEAPRDIPASRATELTPRQWEVVMLVCNRRLDVPEAADALGIEAGTVRKHLDEAAKALDMSVRDLRRRRISLT